MISIVPCGTRNVIGLFVLRSWLISRCPCGTKGRCKICPLLPLRRRRKLQILSPFVGKCRLLSPSVGPPSPHHHQRRLCLGARRLAVSMSETFIVSLRATEAAPRVSSLKFK